MIEYKAILTDGSEYSFNGLTVNIPLIKSLTLGEAGTTFENTIIDKSFGPGAIKLGESRIKQRPLVMKMQTCFENDTAYNTYVNSLISALTNIKYLVDVTNSCSTEVSCAECVESYEKGAYKRIVDFTISFSQLTPYWETLTPVTVNFSTVANTPTIVQLDNTGELAVPTKITLTANAPCSALSLLLQNNNLGISINDAIFGSTDYTTMVLDNKLGSLEIGLLSENSLVVGSLDRKQSIVVGSGFFNIPAGIVYLSVLSTVALSGSLVFNTRHYR
jgi:hypothetical protein